MKRFTEKIIEPDLWGYKVRLDKDYRISKTKDGNIEACGKFVNKLAEYENAEKDGLLVRLPCRVGDTLYYIVTIKGQRTIQELVVASFKILENGKMYFGAYKRSMWWKCENIGKKYFRTREETEKALKNDTSQ